MALNLSTLTSPATSGDVLAEALTTADFLESCPVLRNLARGSNKGGDAEQDVALNQPKALPLIDGDGYLYCSGINGNNANTPDDSSLDITGDLVIDVDVTMKSWTPTSNSSFCGKYQPNGDQRSFRFLLRPDKRVQLQFSDDGTGAGLTGTAFSTELPFADGQRGQVRVSFDSSTGIAQFFTSIDKGATWTQLGPDRSTGKFAIYGGTADVYVGSYSQTGELLPNAAIHSVKFYDSVTPSSSSLRFNCDFTSTNVRHNDTKFKCATGQTVTINQDSSSSNDVATVIKKPVLRFDGVNDFMDGVFGQTLSSGHLFAAFSVLGDGGGSWQRLFSTNPTGGDDASGSMMIRRNSTEDAFRVRYDSAGSIIHDGMYDSARGDMLLDVKITNGEQNSFINNADEENKTLSGTVGVDDFVLAARKAGDFNMPIDLEYLALFDASSITDAQADAVRNFINNRNTVFLRHDTDGYYFYDAQKAPVGNISSGSASWNGRIVGSDNGDTDKYATQATANDQPVGDGYVVTFADTSDHLDIPSTTQAGWQICGTSKGTFAYKVNNTAVTELTMLGNAGTYRAFGDLYGIILLPESATGRDIEEARKLLIDRGASDAAYTGGFGSAWLNRTDIVEFKQTEFQGANNLYRSWKGNSNLVSFSAIQATNSSSFVESWQNCSSLTSFPADAKLGTEASNVDFTSAWRDSGLTSFSTPLPTATTASNAWRDCSSLTSFSAELPLATSVSNAWRGCSSLESFSSALPSVTDLSNAWQDCSSLESFSEELPLVINAYAAWYRCASLESFSTELPLATSTRFAWYQCTSLTDFSADVFANWNPSSILSGVFNIAWDGCTSLTSQSVENILVSIDASGKYATATGASGGSALADAGIDIDYNVATGSLSAATTAAIDSLSGKGWQVYINGEQIIPNILTLEPAAAYSLRSFDADADPNVVNVRRSSDGATSDFTASEVSDGTLRDWTLGDTLALDGQRMYFDGVDDHIDLASTLTISGDFAITAEVLSTGLAGQNTVYGNAGTNRLFIAAGMPSVRIASALYEFTGLTYNQNTIYTTTLTRSGSDLTLELDDGFSVQSETINSVSTADFSLESIGSRAGSSDFFNGVISDINFNGQASYQGYGNTNADWTDQVGSNDATVYGTPALFSGQGFDGHVTTWYDQSSNGRDSSQSTASAQPKIVDGGTLVTDSANNPAIIGDGVDDTLFHPTLTNELDSSDFLVTAAYEDDLAMGIEGAIPRLYIQNGGFSYNTLGTVDYTNQTGRKVLSAQVSGNTQEVFSNGTSLGTATETQVDIGQNMFHVMQGGSAFSDGPLMEVVVFGDNQVANRTGIENNINDTYTIY